MNRKKIFICLLVIAMFFVGQARERNPGAITYDSLIQDIVDRVSIDSCRSTLKELTAIYSRYMGNSQWNNGVVVPLMKRKFLDYGCDSVYETPVPGYDAPVVTGIKKGKKDPSVNRFCFIGAHPDNILSSGNSMGRIYGANDNASGMVAVLEACRVTKDISFENTVCFSALNAEEIGIKGSAELAAYFRENNLEIIGGVITYEMLANAPSLDSGIAYYYSTNISQSEDMAHKIADLAELYNLYTVKLVGVASVPGDIARFWDKGYSGVCGYGHMDENYGPQEHTLADSIGPWTNYEHLRRCTKTGLAALAHYAVPMQQTPIMQEMHASFNNNEIGVSMHRYGEIVFTIKSGKFPMSLNIYSINGKLVKSFYAENNSSNGITVFIWDKKDTRGNPIASGTYVVKCQKTGRCVFKMISVANR